MRGWSKIVGWGKEEGIEICYKILHNDKDDGDADEVDKTCDTLKSCVLAGLHLQLAPGWLDALQIFNILIIIIKFYHNYYYYCPGRLDALQIFIILIIIFINFCHNYYYCPGRLDALQMHIMIVSAWPRIFNISHFTNGNNG